MAFGTNNSYKGGNSNQSRGYQKAAPVAAVSTDGPVEPILTKFMRASKSGKSIASFAVGEKDLVLPAGTRVVISQLTEKQVAGLERTAKEKGYTTSTPTHALKVYPIVDDGKK